MNFRQDELAHRIDLGRLAAGAPHAGHRSPALAALLALAGLATRIALAHRRGDAVERQSLALYQQAFPGQPAPPSVIQAMQQAVGRAQGRADTLGVYRGNLSALDILTEISARIPPTSRSCSRSWRSTARSCRSRATRRPSARWTGCAPSWRATSPSPSITVGDITSDARRGGQSFSMRISLSARGAEERVVNAWLARLRAAYEGLSAHERLLVLVAGGLLAARRCSSSAS